MLHIVFKVCAEVPSISLLGNLMTRESIDPPRPPGRPRSRLVLVAANLAVNSATWPALELPRGRYVYVFDLVAGLAPFSLIVEIGGVDGEREQFDPPALHSAKHLSIFFNV